MEGATRGWSSADPPAGSSSDCQTVPVTLTEKKRDEQLYEKVYTRLNKLQH